MDLDPVRVIAVLVPDVIFVDREELGDDQLVSVTGRRSCQDDREKHEARRS